MKGEILSLGTLFSPSINNLKKKMGWRHIGLITYFPALFSSNAFFFYQWRPLQILKTCSVSWFPEVFLEGLKCVLHWSYFLGQLENKATFISPNQNPSSFLFNESNVYTALHSASLNNGIQSMLVPQLFEKAIIDKMNR